MKSTIKTNWPRYLLQWGVIASLIIMPRIGESDPETYCPMGGLEAFATYLSRGSLPCSMSSLQIVMGLVLAAAVVLFSKFFCGFLCPIGTVEDILTKARKALGINDVEVRHGSVADSVLRLVKYAILFWLFFMTVGASELFCRNMDPYYAVATGFKGEITLWMSLVAIGLVVVPGFFVKRFWCRYICPLGAISNTLKFWLPGLVLVGVWWGLAALGLVLPWWCLLAAFCLAGYLLEVFHSRPRLQVLHVVCDQDLCGRKCYSCRKNCPYDIDVPSFQGKVTCVDCTLCGECVASCPSKALSIGVNPERRNWIGKYVPAALTVIMVVIGIVVGSRLEIPTIDETWNLDKEMRVESLKLEDVRTVKCYGSAMAFKRKMEKIDGVYGVKAFVRSHTVVLKYDPEVIDKVLLEEYARAGARPGTLEH